MKLQQVVPDYVAMVKTSGTCLCLVLSGWVLFKLVQAIFWLPGYLEKNQGRLYQQVEQRSGIAPGGAETQNSPSEPFIERRSDRADTADGDRDAENEGVPSLEEQGEDDASECEADSKKDK